MVPVHLEPKALKKDANGNNIQSRYGSNGFIDEYIEERDVFNRLVTKWSTKKDILDPMPPQLKKIVNCVKKFLERAPSAVWWHNANTDKCAMFGGEHFHIIQEKKPFENFGDISEYRSLRQCVQQNAIGGYVKCAKTHDLQNSVNHNCMAPRVFLGTSSVLIGKCLLKRKTPDLDAIVWEEEAETEIEFAGAPVSSSWGKYGTGSTAAIVGESGQRKRKSDFEDDGEDDGHATCSGLVADSPLTLAHAVQGIKKATYSDMKVVVLKHFCAITQSYTREEITLYCQKLPVQDPLRLRWNTLQHQAGVEKHLESIEVQTRCEYLEYSFEQCLLLYSKTYKRILHDRTSYDVRTSLEYFGEWLKGNGINLTQFVTDAMMVLNTEYPKKCCLCLIGPSNGGKTIFTNGLLEICQFVGRVSSVQSATAFNWATCVNSRLILIAEAGFDRGTLEKFKEICGGELPQAEVKYKSPKKVFKAPVLCTTNVEPWRMANEAREACANRMCIYNIAADPELKQITKPLHPMMWSAIATYFGKWRERQSCANVWDLRELDNMVMADIMDEPIPSSGQEIPDEILTCTIDE